MASRLPVAPLPRPNLAANPSYLATTEPVPVEIGGSSGLQLEASASIGED
jgi:hypothetical protein